MRSLILLVLATAALAAADWPQWRGPNRNGVAPDSPPLIDALPAGSLAQAWEVALPMTGKRVKNYSSPVAAAGKVYLHISPVAPGQGEDVKKPLWTDDVVCVELATGKELWRKSFPSKKNSKLGAPNVPCISGGKLYFVGNEGTAYCLDAATGEPAWTQALGGKRMGSTFSASPIVAGGKVIVSEKQVVALDAASGAKAWSAPVNTSHCSSTVWTKDGVDHLVTGGKELACLKVADGTEVWRLPGGKGPSSPVVDGDLAVFLIEGQGLKVVALKPDGGEVVHTEPLETAGGGHNANTPVFVDGKVYATDKTKIFCFDAVARKMLWTGPKPGDAKPSAIMADGKILFGGKGKTGLTMVDAADGKVLFKTSLPMAGCTSFGLADGKLLVNGKTRLAAFDLAK